MLDDPRLVVTRTLNPKEKKGESPIMSAFVLSAMGPTQVRTHTPRGVLSKSTRTRAAVRPLTKPKRSRLIANAGFDDMGNPIGRDVTFGRGVFTEVETTESSESSDSFSFWGKVKAAFAIFFPPSEEETARLEAKKRLRMILVADRCSLSGGAMTLMKQKVVEAVGEFLGTFLFP